MAQAKVEWMSDFFTTDVKITYGDNNTSIKYTTAQTMLFSDDVTTAYVNEGIKSLIEGRLRLASPVTLTPRLTDSATGTNSIWVKLEDLTTSSTNYSIDNTIASNLTIASDGLSPYYVYDPEVAKREAFRNRIRNQMIFIKKTRSLGGVKPDSPEGKARALLREMIGDKAFANYLRRGSITVVGKTGLRYVIYGNTIKVYAKTVDGKMRQVESICLVFKNHASLPPTDHVIMRKLMIEADEFGMRTVGNIGAMEDTDEVKTLDPSVRNIVKANNPGDAKFVTFADNLVINQPAQHIYVA